MLNIVIPAAGNGQRFIDAGYKDPKPFININNIPMILMVIKNMLPLEDVNITIVVKREHSSYVNKYLQGYRCVYLEKLTDGAARTVLSGIIGLDINDELIIINSDQLIDWPDGGIQSMINFARGRNLDGCISTFTSNSKNFSYAKCNNGRVVEVAEKIVISNHATAGTYYFKTIEMFINSANEMIRRNIRTNGEFYVCPIYNCAIKKCGAIVDIYDVLKVHELGTPDGLIKYLNG